MNSPLPSRSVDDTVYASSEPPSVELGAPTRCRPTRPCRRAGDGRSCPCPRRPAAPPLRRDHRGRHPPPPRPPRPPAASGGAPARALRTISAFEPFENANDATLSQVVTVPDARLRSSSVAGPVLRRRVAPSASGRRRLRRLRAGHRLGDEIRDPLRVVGELRARGARNLLLGARRQVLHKQRVVDAPLLIAVARPRAVVRDGGVANACAISRSRRRSWRASCCRAATAVATAGARRRRCGVARALRGNVHRTATSEEWRERRASEARRMGVLREDEPGRPADERAKAGSPGSTKLRSSRGFATASVARRPNGPSILP